METHYPPSSKRARRSSARHSVGTGWSQCMDGFEGCGFGSSQPKRARAHTRKSLPANAVLFRSNCDIDDIQLSPTALDIEWTQSDEEDGLPFDSQMHSDAGDDTIARDYGHLGDVNERADTAQVKDEVQDMHPLNQSQVMDHLTISSCESTSSNNKIPVQYMQQGDQPTPEGSSPPISCETTPPKDTPVADSAAGRTTNHWMQGLQWQSVTPEKASGEVDDVALAESTRKKRVKYVSGGLAERLQRLLSREKTAKTLWTHKTRNAKRAEILSQKASKKVMTVKVESCSTHNNLLAAICYNITDTSGQSEAALPDSAESKLVLFNQLQAEEMGISPGSVVQIHPPWQTLQGSQRQDIILCTQFCLLLTQGKATEPPGDGEETTFTKPCATWCCPCVSGNVNCANCIAQLKPYIPDVSSLLIRSRLTSERENNTQNNKQEAEPTQHLQLVTLTPQGHRPHQERSILDSVAQSGGCQATGVTFCAVIQRVYRRNIKQSPCWCLLVQDMYGAFSEIHLTSKRASSTLYIEMQGKECKFTGLKVDQRMTREKYCALFTLLDTLWKPEKYAKKVDSQDSCGSVENGLQNGYCGPGFCYSLVSESSNFEITSEGHSKLYCKPEIVPVVSLVKKQEREKCRCTLVGKIVYKHELKDGCTDQKALPSRPSTDLLYVADESVANSDKTKAAESSEVPYTCLCLVLTEDSVVHAEKLAVGSICYLQDVRYHEFALEADSFSTIRLLPSPDDAGLPTSLSSSSSSILAALQPRLPPFQQVHTLHSLVILKGVVTDVDEESAYTWAECNRCGNSDLVSQHTANIFLFCQRCNKGVTDPVNKMKLQVYLMSDIPHCKFKVELLQSTIEALLPEEADDEGYELQAVLDKSIGPLNCLVLSSSQKKESNDKEFFLQEIQYPLHCEHLDKV